MPVTLVEIGIQSVSLALVEGIDRERKVEVKTILASGGEFGAGAAVDPINEFSITGRGDFPTAIVLGVDEELEIADISAGVTIITRAREGQKNDDFQTWEVSGTNYPGASAPDEEE